jgi:hypothetical protein
VDWIVVFELPYFPPMPVQDLYPPTIPRALQIIRAEGWQARGKFAVSVGGRDAVITAYQRPTSTL